MCGGFRRVGNELGLWRWPSLGLSNSCSLFLPWVLCIIIIEIPWAPKRLFRLYDSLEMLPLLISCSVSSGIYLMMKLFSATKPLGGTQGVHNRKAITHQKEPWCSDHNELWIFLVIYCLSDDNRAPFFLNRGPSRPQWKCTINSYVLYFSTWLNRVCCDSFSREMKPATPKVCQMRPWLWKLWINSFWKCSNWKSWCLWCPELVELKLKV